MASDGDACCESDPNFAVICGFLEKFGVSCGLTSIDFLDLQDMLENNQEVAQELVDLHVKLLRKARKSVSSERWERAIIKFCHGFCSQDAWEIERFGYKKARLSSKLRILKELLEIQFDYNSKFKNEVNKLSADELRTQPLGRDQLGHIYWFQSDNSCQIRVYKEDPDEETWALVAKNREGLVGLITQLNDGNDTVVNEDSNSLESEKPVVDTGQTDSNSNSSKPEQFITDVSTESSHINGNGDATKIEEEIKPETNDTLKEEEVKRNENITEYIETNQMNLKLKGKKAIIDDLNRVNEVPVEEQIIKDNNDDQPKVGINLRIKPVSELVSTTVDVCKKSEVTGIKEKYIRSDSTSSSVPHRKAVDSAGFDVHTNYLKRPPHDEEDMEEPSYVKRPRLDRPTLLGNKRKKSYSDDEDEVSDEITEPLMLVKGEGNGKDNNGENSPIIGEAIEESVIYVAGEGSGFDCETGNEQSQPQTSTPVPDQVDGGNSTSTQIPNNENIDSNQDGENSSNHVKFKLGTIIDVRSDRSTVGSTTANKTSRWDMGKPPEELEDLDSRIQCDSIVETKGDSSSTGLSDNLKEINNKKEDEETLASNKSMFFFGPGCLQVKPTISPIKKTEEVPDEELVNSAKDNSTDFGITPKPDEISNDKPRSIVIKRRKSEKPVRKISGSDLECKEMLLSKESNCEVSDLQIGDIKLRKEMDVLSPSVKLKGGNEVQSNNVNNTLLSTNYVPKSIINISDEKGDSSKSIDNKFVVDVPLNKVDCTNNAKSDKAGLPIAKNISTVMDKPKSKLENVLEKINQGKVTKKTDGLDLSNKYKNNNLLTNIDSKVVDHTPCLAQTVLAGTNVQSTTVQEPSVLSSTGDSSKHDISAISTNISTNHSILTSLSTTSHSESVPSPDKSCEAASLSPSNPIKSKSVSECNSTLESSSSHLVDSRKSPTPTDESNDAVEEIPSQESIDIPKLEDNSRANLVNQNLMESLDLSPPSLEREDLQQVNSENDSVNHKTTTGAKKKEAATSKSKFNKSKELDTNNKSKKIHETSKNKSIENEEIPNDNVISRRITRRTRSNADKFVCSPPASNDREKEMSNKTEEVKPKTKQPKKKEVEPLLEIDKELVALATNRELRERKVVENKEIKPKGKAQKAKVDVKKTTRNHKEKKAVTRSQASKEDLNKVETVQELSIKDVEEQIVQPESAPTKKLKLTESTDKNEKISNTLTTESGKLNDSNELSDKDDLKIQEECDPLDVSKEPVPVNEPICIEKKVALLTDEVVDQRSGNPIIPNMDGSCIDLDDGNSSDIMLIADSDPLACSEDDLKTSEPVMTLASFKIDVDESNSILPMRVTRKRAAQQSIDTLRESTNNRKKVETQKKDGDTSKRPKLKRKRSADKNLRRSVEAKKSKEISSSDDDNVKLPAVIIEESETTTSKSIEQRRESNRSSSPIPSSGDSRTDTSGTPRETKEKKPRQIRKTLLGLDITPETEHLFKEDASMGVRQSRRIAQLKIKEEAERRKLEEMTLHELKEEQRIRKGKKDIDKDYKLEKKKRSKQVPTEDETTTGEGESDEKKKRKKKRKHRDPGKQFDVHNPWKSSSGSSSSEEEEEEEEIEEDEDRPLVLKSDHEFSPESDLEGDAEVQPLKRARTAKKESDPEEEVDDCACQKCGQRDHPEWILLCDSCDSGWHCSCLRPALLVIPEGDWFCPPCQHATLVKKLESQLIEYDKRINKKLMETRRKERLAYVGISLDNVLPSKETDEHRTKNKYIREDDDDATVDSDSDESGSDSDSISSSESDSEPIYQLRKRRQAHSYRFNDYDDLINSAIQDELDAVKGAGNQGRGKDISTIVNAEKEEAEARLNNESEVVETGNVDDVPTDLTMKSSTPQDPQPELEPLPPVVPPDYDKKHDNEESDEEIIRPVRRVISKKKHRKLNSLDVSSGDDAESDEDFKGSSSSGSDDEDDYAGSDSSEDLDLRKGKRHKDSGPIRRSTRARISRYDRDFINDDTDTDGAGPRRKKNRSTWEESESEESDRSWGRRKRRAARSRKKPSDKPKRSKKKKKKHGDDSDPEVYKKRPNIKFGTLNDDEEIGRRTRGKKINYLEALGTDSDDDVRRKPPRIEESDDEYAVHEDEELQQRLQNDNDSDESGVENVLRDLPLPLNPRPKPRGRGKAGLKIPRKPKDPNIDLFPPLIPDLPPASTIMSAEIPVLQQALQSQPLMPQQMIPPPLIMDPSVMHEHESQDLDDEPNPIEQINKNVEQMNEQEMEKMMEEEDYANRQLQLVALQIEKEKKRKERELQRLEKLMQVEPKIPKKRGRKPKNQMLSATNLMSPFSETSMLMPNNAELSEPPGVSLPLFSELAPALNADGSLKKRRGRGKGKKTLAAEAAAAAASNKSIDTEIGLEGPTSSSSNTVSPAPDSPMHGSKLGIAAPPQPFSQSQPTPSVITRMLQSQPGQANFPPSAVSKYFGGPGSDPQLGPYHPGAPSPRGALPSPYQQSAPGIPHFPVIRSGPPPLRLHSPGAPGLPPMYHTHRSLDPSPSGGGPINVPSANRDRQSPAVVSPSSNSPLSKGDPTPPPYTRPPVGHFPPVASSTAPGGPRPLPIIPPHLQQHRPSNMAPFHPTAPPNYHYGSYPPPPPLTSDEGQSPPGYPAPAYSEQYPEGGAPIQTTEPGSIVVGTGKPFEEGDEGGEFVGLVSYFSSQREDDLDT